MRKARRTMSIILAMVMLFALSACGTGGTTTTATTATTTTATTTAVADTPSSATEAPTVAPEPATEPTATTTADTTTAAPAADRVQLTFALWGGEDEQQTTQDVLNKFNASQDRIQVTALAIPWETYTEKLNTMAVANELPDTGMVNEGFAIQYADMGLLADASAMYEGQPAPLDALTFKYNGTPVAYSTANEILMTYYNKDMFDAAGVEYPPTTADEAWTWDEFVEVAKKLTLDANGLTPNDAGFDKNNIVQYGCMVENLTWQLEVWALSNGAGFYADDGSVIINDPATIEAIQRVADLHLVHNVAPLSTGLTDDGVPRSLVAGTVAMTTNGAWNMGTCLAAARDEGLNYGVGVLPYMQEKITINTGGPAAVFAQTKYPEEAMEFMRWYSSPDNNWQLIADGIWMPNLESYYTDPALTDKWLNNPAYPPYDEAKAVLVDYTNEYSVGAAWYRVNNTGDFNTLLGNVLGPVWTGEATAEAAITANVDALIAANQGM